VIMNQIHQRQKGLSVIEFALVLPILIFFLMGVVDYARTILYNNILINMSREGANLASRTITSRKYIIDTINSTALPLDMSVNGMFYITRVQGVDGGNNTVIAVIQEQYRATTGLTTLNSKTWVCPTSWDTQGSCVLPSSISSKTIILPFSLALNDEVQIVEVLYHHVPLMQIIEAQPYDLYSKTLL